MKSTLFNELRAEASRLRKQLRLIEAFLEGVVDERNGRSVEVGTISNSTEELSIEVDGSLAANVRVALQLIGETTTSRKVATKLIELGLPDKRNETPLQNLVAVELFRQSKKRNGVVFKKSRGRYKYVGTDAGVDAG